MRFDNLCSVFLSAPADIQLTSKERRRLSTGDDPMRWRISTPCASNGSKFQLLLLSEDGNVHDAEALCNS